MKNYFSFFCKKCNYNFMGTREERDKQRDLHKIPAIQRKGWFGHKKGDPWICPMVSVGGNKYRRPQIAEVK